jgi:alkanesulfonate monooxygenase SsuD/methylene tetrahydromethanopterin reductase-like flavin-dependent oxidoreductase (luciferase family)
VPWPRRAARTREYIDVMKRLWSDEVKAFDGEFYRLPECLHNPKPVQRPHPPIFFGGESDGALARVADQGQGWFGFNLTPAALPEHLKRLDEKLAGAGRTRDELQIYVSPYLAGADADALRAYEDLGVDQVILPLFARDESEAERRMDGIAALV